MERYPVLAEKLRRRLDPASLPFKSTQEVSPLRGALGQERATEALHFGVGVDSVIEPGDHQFGIPTRISASVGLDRGVVESIERETETGGPLHNKGLLIVSGYVAAKYGQQWPLALRATLTFDGVI